MDSVIARDVEPGRNHYQAVRGVDELSGYVFGEGKTRSKSAAAGFLSNAASGSAP